MSNVLLNRELGNRYFTKGDGVVYLCLPTGKVGADGKPEYADKVISNSGIDAQAALSITEYKKIDSVITDTRNAEDRFSAWMRSLTGNVETFNGLDCMEFYYHRKTGDTVSRMGMNLEDDAPGTSFRVEEDGVPLPLEYADWQTGIRRDSVTSAQINMDVAAEKARMAGESVATGLDLRQINGWGGLTHRGMVVYGFRDVPTTLTVPQAGTGAGWLNPSTSISQIYADIKAMVKLMDAAKIPGPYVLVLPMEFRHRLAETYSTTLNGEEKSLWMKILEKPSANIPNVLNIAQIKLVTQMDELKGGGAPTVGEAYLLSLSPKYFRVLNYLPMQSFTIDLKGTIATKHRVAEGLCPLFKKDIDGKHGIVKLTAPAE